MATMDTAGDSGRLTTLLRADAVPMATLRRRYGALLELVRTLIGVVPNCDAYLEIWPPAFRIYNILVPNFLNLPFSIFGFGGPPAALVGLGMYVASRAAGCPYCSAHTCSFALRRGASTELLARAFTGRDGPLSARELATVAVARSLAKVPCELTDAERLAFQEQWSKDDAEWVVCGVAMMGFLNKFMDAIGVDLEGSTAAEAKTALGTEWSPGQAGKNLGEVVATGPPPRDSLWTKLRIIPYMPSALRLDRAWQRGVPQEWPAVGAFLEGKVGHDFPLLSRLRHGRVRRAIASMLRESLDAGSSVLGLQSKILAGAIFATVVEDQALMSDLHALAARASVSTQELDAATAFARSPGGAPAAGSQRLHAIWFLARAASPSPARIDSQVVQACAASGLSAAAIVELVSWLAVLQLLHRLHGYFLDRTCSPYG